MGLDMYLIAERYVSNWEHNKDKDEKKRFKAITDAIGLVPTEHSPSIDVQVKIGYWRKANAIHNWFVENVQDGKDECQTSYVSREQLKELREICQEVLDGVELVDGEVRVSTTYNSDGTITENTEPGKVIANSDFAASKLPTTKGFFFGGTEYNQYYIDDLKDTIVIIDKALALDDNWDFHYRASW